MVAGEKVAICCRHFNCELSLRCTLYSPLYVLSQFTLTVVDMHGLIVFIYIVLTNDTIHQIVCNVYHCTSLNVTIINKSQFESGSEYGADCLCPFSAESKSNILTLKALVYSGTLPSTEQKHQRNLNYLPLCNE